MLAASTQRCHLCMLRIHQLTGPEVSTISESEDIMYCLNHNSDTSSALDLMLRFSYPSTESNKWINKFFQLVSSNGRPISDYLSAIRCSEMQGEGISEPFFSRRNSCTSSSLFAVNFWTAECASYHEACNALKSKTFALPTRLVYVGDPDAKTRPKLCLSEDLPPGTKYATLSHCWGQRKYETLTKSSYLAMLRLIEIDEMGPIFRDIMTITTSFGMSYIWIDALCIIQDSLEDWLAESTRMAEVFQNAFINFGATAAADGWGRLFPSRAILDVDPCRLVTSWDDLPSMFLSCYDSDLWERNILQAPLMQRAWVFQEHMLTPRMVHFANGQLFWQCVQLKACETFPDLLTAPMNTSMGFPTETLKTKVLTDAQSATFWLASYCNVVTEYTKCNLTYPEKDKLVAFSAIARRFKPAECYLAGLWREHLKHQICWHVFDPRNEGDTQMYRAPSWSWASVNGAVFLGVFTIEDKVPNYIDLEILEAKVVQKAGGDTFTAKIIDGHLLVNGFLASGLVTSKRVGSKSQTYFGQIPCRIHWDRLEEAEVARHGKEYYFLVVRSNKDCTAIHGLALSLTKPGASPSEYCRKGKFTISDNNQISAVTSFLGQYVRNQAGSGSSVEDNPMLPRHTIKII